MNEFFHSEAEIKGNLSTVMELVEEYVLYITYYLTSKHHEEIKYNIGSVDHIQKILNKNYIFPRIRFIDAKALLKNDPKYFKKITHGIEDITHEGEKALINYFDGAVWLTHLPKSLTPFYQATDIDNVSSLAADLLIGIGETVGCGERHKDYASTLNSLKAHYVDIKPYDWYLNLKRHYPLQTAGFGLGIERYLLWLLNHNDIRDIPILPRIKNLNNFM